MEKDQCEENFKKPSEGGTTTIKGPKEAETPEREETRQPHELPSADPLVTESQNLSYDFITEIEEEIESNQSVDLRTDDMDTSELVRYLMSPMNMPGDALEDEVETFNHETALNYKIYQDDDMDVINLFDDESFVEG